MFVLLWDDPTQLFLVEFEFDRCVIYATYSLSYPVFALITSEMRISEKQ